MTSRSTRAVRRGAGSSARSGARAASSGGGILGLPATFAGLLVGERHGRRLLFRGVVEWGLRLRTVKELLRRGREVRRSPFDDFRFDRSVTWLEPTLHVDLTYSESWRGAARSRVSRARLTRGWLEVCASVCTAGYATTASLAICLLQEHQDGPEPAAS